MEKVVLGKDVGEVIGGGVGWGGGEGSSWHNFALLFCWRSATNLGSHLW